MSDSIPSDHGLMRWRMIRFAGVGIGAACLYVVLSALLVAMFPGHKLIISISVYASIIPMAFWGQRGFAFRSKGPIISEFAKYSSLQIFSVSLSTLLLKRLVMNGFFMDLLAFTLMAIMATAINFLICHFLIFNSSQSASL